MRAVAIQAVEAASLFDDDILLGHFQVLKIAFWFYNFKYSSFIDWGNLGHSAA